MSYDDAKVWLLRDLPEVNDRFRWSVGDQLWLHTKIVAFMGGEWVCFALSKEEWPNRKHMGVRLSFMAFWQMQAVGDLVYEK